MDELAQIDSQSGSLAGSKNVLRFGSRKDSTMLSDDNNEAVAKGVARDRMKMSQMIREMGGGQRRRKRRARLGAVRTPLWKPRFWSSGGGLPCKTSCGVHRWCKRAIQMFQILFVNSQLNIAPSIESMGILFHYLVQARGALYHRWIGGWMLRVERWIDSLRPILIGPLVNLLAIIPWQRYRAGCLLTFADAWPTMVSDPAICRRMMRWEDLPRQPTCMCRRPMGLTPQSS